MGMVLPHEYRRRNVEKIIAKLKHNIEAQL